MKNGSLYLVTGQDVTGGGSTFAIAREAVEAGVDVLQMREKAMARPDLVGLGRDLAALCREQGALFIVNDDPELAAEVDADGVHLGQEDAVAWGLGRTRDILGPERLIGLSTHNPDQAVQGMQLDVDYIGYGPLFPTKTKNYSIGLDDLPEVMAAAVKPVVCIGGINTDNAAEVLGAGGRIIAVIRAIMQAADVTETVQIFKDKLAAYCGGDDNAYYA